MNDKKKFIPDARLWKLMLTEDPQGMPEFEMQVFEYTGNYNNNGDKFLVHLQFECQEALMVPIDGEELFNNLDYHFPELYETPDIWFIVVGNVEISLFLNALGKKSDNESDNK